MCIFLMVATNEICKFKVKFTLFSPSPVILNDDIHWTKLILFFEIDFFFDLTHKRAFWVPSVHEKKRNPFSCHNSQLHLIKKIINVLFGKFLLFYELYIDHRTPEKAGLLPIEGVLRLGCYYLICMSIYVLKMCARYLLLIYIPYKYESVLIVFQLYFG